MQNKFLPIGSVVLLKKGTKLLVVCGYCTKTSEDSLVYDYTGIAYPEGIQASDNFIFFNHDDINQILYKGYESKDFLELIKEMVQQFGGNDESN